MHQLDRTRNPSYENPEVLSHFWLSSEPLGKAKKGDAPTWGLMVPSYGDPKLGIDVLYHFKLSSEPLGMANKSDAPTRG